MEIMMFDGVQHWAECPECKGDGRHCMRCGGPGVIPVEHICPICNLGWEDEKPWEDHMLSFHRMRKPDPECRLSIH